jgi:adenylate kinase
LYLILLGSPGTGKGTQANILAGRFQWLHVSTGDMLREAVAAGTELGKTAKGFMDQGALVPDNVVIGMLVERIQRPDAEAGFVLDGFPRNLAQAIALDEALRQQGKSIDAVLNIVVPEEELLTRLTGRWMCPNCGEIYHAQSRPPAKAGICDKCGSRLVQRDDDKRDTVMARLEKQRTPDNLLAHYRDQRKLKDIDGQQAVDKVTADLLAAIEGVGAK